MHKIDYNYLFSIHSQRSLDYARDDTKYKKTGDSTKRLFCGNPVIALDDIVSVILSEVQSKNLRFCLLSKIKLILI